MINQNAPSILDQITAPEGTFEWMLQAQEKVITSGWRWRELAPVFDKLREEATELEEAAAGSNRADMVSELGDLLWMATILCHYLNVTPQEAIHAITPKVRRRFGAVEQNAQASGRTIAEVPVDEQRAWYKAVKDSEKEEGAA